VSLVFTGLALAPLPVLVLWLLASGALSMPAFPSGPAALWALLFHGGIGALLVLYWLFWTKLNLAQTLPLAVGIGLATAAVGFKALSALADARLQSERAAATPAKKTN
jgi:oligosaccharyltransferase complex subunit delta (ribophorin II)